MFIVMLRILIYSVPPNQFSSGKLTVTSASSSDCRPVERSRKDSLSPRKVVLQEEEDGDDGDSADEDSDATIVDEDEEHSAPVSKAKAAVESSRTTFRPCHLCGLTYTSAAALAAHHASTHSANKNVMRCELCMKKGKKVLLTGNNLRKHLNRRHNVAKPLAEKLARNAEDKQLQMVLEVSAASEQNASNTDKPASTTQPPVKRLRLTTEDSNYVCAKCEFSTASRQDFHAHIVQEHVEENTAQCLECGLCFSAISSLKKHLFLVHKVKQPAAYVEEHGITLTALSEDVAARMDALAPLGEQEIVMKTSGYQNALCSRSFTSAGSFDSDEEVTEKRKRKRSRGGSEFECNVCYKDFDSESALKSHMRNHGMAFIRSRRADSRQKSTSQKDTAKPAGKLDKKSD